MMAVRVRFDATLDEFVDVSLRMWRRQYAALPFWRRDAVAASVLGAVVLFLMSGPPIARRLVAAGMGLVLGAVFYPILRESSWKRQATRSLREWLGGRPTALVEVEPRAQGIWIGQNDAEMLWPWRDVTGIDESSSDLQIHLVQHGLIIVRGRAFPDPAVRSAFIAEIRSRMAGG